MRGARVFLVLAGVQVAAIPAGGVAAAECAWGLSDAVAIARRYRPEVAQGELDRRRSALSLMRARLNQVHLTLNVSAAEQRQRLNIRGASAFCVADPATCAGEAHPFNAAATLAVPLWTGMALDARIAGARALERSADAQLQVTLNAVGFEAAAAYWAARRLELVHEVVAAGLQQERDIERMTDEKVKSGISPLVDYDRAHSLVARRQQQLISLEGQIDEARAQLALALHSDEPCQLTSDPAALRVRLPTGAAAAERAFAARPELRAAQAAAQTQWQAVRAARGDYWPQVALFGEATVQDRVSFLPARREELIFTAVAGAQVTWTIFDMLATWSAARDASLLAERVELDQSRQRDVIRADVRSAHAALRTAVQVRALAEQAVVTQRESATMLQHRYLVGSALLLELLLAQADLVQMELDVVEGRISVALAQSRLDAAMAEP